MVAGGRHLRPRLAVSVGSIGPEEPVPLSSVGLRERADGGCESHILDMCLHWLPHQEQLRDRPEDAAATCSGKVPTPDR